MNEAMHQLTTALADRYQIERELGQGGMATGLCRRGSGGKPGGIGEVGVPLAAPALANAVFALTGKRIRSTPLEDGGVRFVG